MKHYYWQFIKELHSMRERLKFLEHDHPRIYDQFKLKDLAESLEKTYDEIEQFVEDEYEQFVQGDDVPSPNDSYF